MSQLRHTAIGKNGFLMLDEDGGRESETVKPSECNKGSHQRAFLNHIFLMNNAFLNYGTEFCDLRRFYTCELRFEKNQLRMENGKDEIGNLKNGKNKRKWG